MHATRARLPQKRTAKKTATKKSPAKKVAPKLALAEALPLGVASLAAHRAQLPQRAPLGVEIYATVEWIAPARESWRAADRRGGDRGLALRRDPDAHADLARDADHGDRGRLGPGAPGAAAGRPDPGLPGSLNAQL
jgi:hypothetical protein